ncbi:hypothetical protein EDF38_0172 [Frigoribacterium sp. PhB160]|uniref:hypothetical protein n=1 Tax=Frigoribacterium sp. PhB160 TaxID=2485192 RepID=UPI000F47FE82|nr:hypothetical protein [Frigoribacterium sp. PhB160]ROS61091.1 hypothetical protein EDF38_0172 [Frigoribacterium sp. PhB160]
MSSPDPFLVRLFFAATHGDGAKETLALRRGAASGELVRLHRGVYGERAEVERLDARGRHVVLCRAVSAGLDPSAVVSHASAAAVWDLPRIVDPDDVVDVVDPRRERVRRSTHLRRRPGAVPDHDERRVGDLSVTSLERTAVDVALTAGFAAAVLCLDGVLRRLVLPRGHEHGLGTDRRLQETRAALSSRLGGEGRRGGVAARRALAFASPWAENGGESLLRLVLHELGVGEMSLQREFRRDGRLAGRVDVFLEQHRTAVELDGFVKLTDPEMLGARSPAAAARDQNRRDQRLLMVPEVRHVVHCEYGDIVVPERLAGLLVRAGVPLDPRRIQAAVRAAARRFAAHP